VGDAAILDERKDLVLASREESIIVCRVRRAEDARTVRHTNSVMSCGVRIRKFEVEKTPDISFETALLKFPHKSLSKTPYKLHAIGPYNS